jgi:hypothetical protein
MVITRDLLKQRILPNPKIAITSLLTIKRETNSEIKNEMLIFKTTKRAFLQFDKLV